MEQTTKKDKAFLARIPMDLYTKVRHYAAEEDLYKAFKIWYWPEESPYIRKHCHWLSEEHCWEYLLNQREVIKYFFASRRKEFKRFKRETFDRLLEEDEKRGSVP